MTAVAVWQHWRSRCPLFVRPKKYRTQRQPWWFWRFRRLWRFRSWRLLPLNSTHLFGHPGTFTHVVFSEEFPRRGSRCCWRRSINIQVKKHSLPHTRGRQHKYHRVLQDTTHIGEDTVRTPKRTRAVSGGAGREEAAGPKYRPPNACEPTVNRRKTKLHCDLSSLKTGLGAYTVICASSIHSAGCKKDIASQTCNRDLLSLRRARVGECWCSSLYWCLFSGC